MNMMQVGAVSVLISALFLFGCTPSLDLSKRGLSVERVSNPKTYFRQVWAEEDAGGFRVRGKLHLKDMIASSVPVFVQVDWVDPDGEIIHVQKVPYCPKILTGKKRDREARFSAHFEEAPPPGTVIRLSNVN